MATKTAKNKTEVSTSVVNPVRRITTKLMIDNKATEAIFYGFALSFEIINNQYGDSVKYMGEFRADINGQQFEASQMFLPSIVEAQLKAALENVDDVGSFTGIAFKYKIFQQPNENSKTGYEWLAKPLMNAERGESRLDKLLTA